MCRWPAKHVLTARQSSHDPFPKRASRSRAHFTKRWNIQVRNPGLNRNFRDEGKLFAFHHSKGFPAVSGNDHVHLAATPLHEVQEAANVALECRTRQLET
eukprot:1878053-Amphidinium_carterae.1